MTFEKGKNRYFTDPENDDFQVTKVKKMKNVNGEYKYIRKNIFLKIFDFFLYYLVAVPCLKFYSKYILRVKVKGKKNLKPIKKQGFIMYGNHTQNLDPFFLATLVLFPKRVHVVTSPIAVSVPFARFITRSLGAVPVASTLSGIKKMGSAVSYILKTKKRVLVVYPEAHMWSYFTGIREFKSASFKFATANNVPAVPFAVTYKKRTRGFGKNKRVVKPQILISIGKPIFKNPNLTDRDNAEVLARECQRFVKDECMRNSNFEYYNYMKVSSTELEEIKKASLENSLLKQVNNKKSTHT